MNLTKKLTTRKNEINMNKSAKNNKINTKKSLNEQNSNKNKEDLIKKAYETKLIWYIKALLQIYKTLPNIISIIDKIVERKASSLIPASSIYGNTYSNTINQINKVLDMTARKDKLVNLYVLIEEMLNNLPSKDKTFAKLKFIQKNSTQDIIKELKIAERTVYRNSKLIIEKIAIYLLNRNYTVAFFNNQIGNESWIYEIINQKIKEDSVNNNRYKIKVYNKSSSSTVS